MAVKARAQKIIGSVAVALALSLVGFVVLGSIDVRGIGRNDPKRASNYRLPWRNFAETYGDGAVLGVVIGSTKTEAIQAAARAGLIVTPSGWGDSRAGGASLYDRTALLATMLRQPYLNYDDQADLRRGLTIYFRGDHVSRISVHYINTEGT